MRKKLVALMVAVLFVSLAQATPVEQVVNGSFEAGSQPVEGSWGFWGPAGDNWAFGGDAVSILRAAGGPNPWWGRVPDDGAVFVAISAADGETSWISQQLEGLVIGESYSVNLAATLGPGESGTSGLEVYIGGTKVLDTAFMRYGWYDGIDDLGMLSYVANATDGSNPLLKIVHVNDSGATHKMLIDSVTVLGAEVPEPATIALLGLGGLVAGAIKRRRG